MASLKEARREGGTGVRSRTEALEVPDVADAAGTPLTENPFIYEIDTWVWLEELSRRDGTTIDLAAVPAGEWDAIP